MLCPSCVIIFLFAIFLEETKAGLEPCIFINYNIKRYLSHQKKKEVKQEILNV